MFRRRKIYNIDSKAANETLQNIFAACDQEPNNTPLELLKVRNLASTAIVKTGFWMGIILLCLIIIMPLAFVNQGSEGGAIQEITIKNHYLDYEDECFVLTFEGGDIVYEQIYAKRDDGSTVYPFKIDKDKKTIKIPFKEGNLNIYVPKEDGTVLHAVLSK